MNGILILRRRFLFSFGNVSESVPFEFQFSLNYERTARSLWFFLFPTSLSVLEQLIKPDDQFTSEQSSFRKSTAFQPPSPFFICSCWWCIRVSLPACFSLHHDLPHSQQSSISTSVHWSCSIIKALESWHVGLICSFWGGRSTLCRTLAWEAKGWKGWKDVLLHVPLLYKSGLHFINYGFSFSSVVLWFGLSFISLSDSLSLSLPLYIFASIASTRDVHLGGNHPVYLHEWSLWLFLFSFYLPSSIWFPLLLPIFQANKMITLPKPAPGEGFLLLKRLSPIKKDFHLLKKTFSY